MDTTVTDPLTGRLLGGRYRIGDRIARGGMATVYQAIDTRLGRSVACKVMHPGLCDDAGFVRRFVREARSAARLSHPNVVAVFDQGEDGDVVYLAMEHVPGMTLRRLISRRGPLPPDEALEIIDRILAALSAAHDAGLIHRDVKPENVLLEPGGSPGSVKVADFGLARAITASTSSTATQGQLIGTVSYLAPEQVVHGHADARSDVYAAGVVLYEMLTGRKPHTGESPIQVAYQHVHEDVQAPSEEAFGIPDFVDALVQRATARDPDLRPADAGAFLRQARRAEAALAGGVDDPELTRDLAGADTASIDTASIDTANTSGSDGSGSDAAGTDGGDTDGGGTDGGGTDGGGANESGPFSAPKRRRRPWLALLIGLPILALVAAAWYLGVYRYTQVPQLAGLARPRAERVTTAADLRLRVAGHVYSEVIDRGHLVRTKPEPSERVRKGEAVRVWLSRGPERHPMPDLDGKTHAQAERLADRADLRVARVERAYSDTIPRGTVIRFSPKPGTSLAPGSRVSLVLSKGPAPVKIPDAVGKDSDQVRQTLQDRGLTATTSSRHSSSVAEGKVISQQPEAGTGHRGDTVHLVVSKGPRMVTVPVVRGDGESGAKQQLQDAGFDVDVRHSDVYVGLHVVVRQNPGGGTTAPEGSTIVLEIV